MSDGLRLRLRELCRRGENSAETKSPHRSAGSARCPVTRWRRNGLRSRGVAIRVYTDERVNFAARSRTSGPGCRITLPVPYLMPQRESTVLYLSPSLPFSPTPLLPFSLSLFFFSPLSFSSSLLSHLVSSGCSLWKPRSRRRRPNSVNPRW